MKEERGGCFLGVYHLFSIYLMSIMFRKRILLESVCGTGMLIMPHLGTQAQQPAAVKESKPNIIFILADDIVTWHVMGINT